MKTKTKTKTKTALRARKMFANYYPGITSVPTMHPSRSRALGGSAGTVSPVPVAVIPLDNPEALVHCAYEASRLPGEDGLTQMRAALTAIGVLPRTRKGGAK